MLTSFVKDNSEIVRNRHTPLRRLPGTTSPPGITGNADLAAREPVPVKHLLAYQNTVRRIVDTSSETVLILIGRASAISNDKIQLKWECRDQLEEIYVVDRHHLRYCATDVRNDLHHVITACGVSERHYYTIQLLEDGTKFFNAVLPADGDRSAKAVRSWYDSQRLHAKRLDIRMIWNVYVDLPWGLIFSPATPSSTDCTLARVDPSTLLKLLHNFWCVQHRLVICKAPEVYETAERRLPREDYELFPTLTRCEPYSTDSLEEDNRTDKRGLAIDLRKWRGAVLYFCCEYDGTRLHCEQFIIDADDIRMLGREFKEQMCFDARSRGRVGLIFFNGCDVHVGRDENEGLKWRVNLYEQWDGFVDTEVPLVSSESRIIFCELAVKLLGDKKPFQLVNEEVRETHLPLSLAYTIYCSPDYYFQPHEAMPDLRARMLTICPGRRATLPWFSHGKRDGRTRP